MFELFSGQYLHGPNEQDVVKNATKSMGRTSPLMEGNKQYLRCPEATGLFMSGELTPSVQPSLIIENFHVSSDNVAD